MRFMSQLGIRRPPLRAVSASMQRTLVAPSTSWLHTSRPRNTPAVQVMKTVWRLRRAKAKRVAMQFPEGLLMYASVLSDILEQFAGVEQTFILGDVTYGACCIDDLSAAAAGADFLLHYGHSCLVPVSRTVLPCLYIFVDIRVDLEHLVATVQLNFKREQKLVLAGTVQFLTAIHVRRSPHSVAHPRGPLVPPC
jgi:2-(3-amino-3-carboxypropyl)histidine synthase